MKQVYHLKNRAAIMTLLESNDRGVSEKLAIMTFSDKAVIVDLNNKGNKMHNLSRSLSLYAKYLFEFSKASSAKVEKAVSS